MKTTGSRAGYVGDVKVFVPNQHGVFVPIPVRKWYDPRFWREDDDFAWQDRLWTKPPVGIAKVGPLESDGVRKRSSGQIRKMWSRWPARLATLRSGQNNGRSDLFTRSFSRTTG